jgi:hypothetical protein
MRARRWITSFGLAVWMLGLAATAAADAARAELPPQGALTRYDGTAQAPRARLSVWRQIALELSAFVPPDFVRSLRAALVGADTDPDVIPVAVLDMRTPVRLFVAVPLRDQTHRGDVAFAIDRDRWLPTTRTPAWITLDCGDGAGPRAVRFGEPVAASYATPGVKHVILRAGDAGGTRESRFEITVLRLAQPRPDDTLRVAARVGYKGATAAGRAYVYLGAGHTKIERPLVVPEGFDLSNDQYADELYALLDRGGLATRMRELGHDVVVLDFDDATDYLQRNAFVLAALIERLQGELPPEVEIAVAGPSIGGVMSRYALAWMEREGLPHRVRTVVTLDAPHGGANVPLGLQHWFLFFADVSAAADHIIERMHRPAAKQILLEFHRPGLASSRGPDPLRAELLQELDALGWPARPRLVAIANGSGTGTTLFAPGAPLLRYRERSFVRRFDGNVWAVPDGGPGVVFQGQVTYFVPLKSQTVVVTGTVPLDGAPGGFRNTMLMMDTTAVPYGDITAITPAHCFVPTVSALGLDLPLGADLRAVPDLAAHSPFDTVYFPLANQEHVELTEENSAWFERELTLPSAPAPAPAATLTPELEAAPRLSMAPNPATSDARVRFRLDRPGRARVVAHDLAGRLVATLIDGVRAAGLHEIEWPRVAGDRVAPGVYLLSLESGGTRHTIRVTRVE